MKQLISERAAFSNNEQTKNLSENEFEISSSFSSVCIFICLFYYFFIIFYFDDFFFFSFEDF